MAKLYISEYFALKRVEGAGVAQLVDEDSFIQTQVADFTSGHAEKTLDARTTIVRLCADAVCSLAYGTAPVATTNDKRLPADTLEYLGVRGSRVISVVANT